MDQQAYSKMIYDLITKKNVHKFRYNPDFETHPDLVVYSEEEFGFKNSLFRYSRLIHLPHREINVEQHKLVKILISGYVQRTENMLHHTSSDVSISCYLWQIEPLVSNNEEALIITSPTLERSF